MSVFGLEVTVTARPASAASAELACVAGAQDRDPHALDLEGVERPVEVVSVA